MKKFMSRIEKLGQKSAQIQAAMERVPGKIAQFREAVAMTTGQLQQLRTDVQASVGDLRADDEEHLLQALHEIRDSQEAFEEAGYELASVEMEISPNHRLLIALNKFEETSAAAVRTVAAANQRRKTAHAILTALAQAQETSYRVDLGELVQDQVIVHVGPRPAVRLCWNVPAAELAPQSASTAVVQTTAATPVEASSFPSGFGQSSFFERRPNIASSPEPAPSVPQPPPASASASEASQSSAQGASHTSASSALPNSTAPATDWRREALERFKKMPDLSKYGR